MGGRSWAMKVLVVEDDSLLRTVTVDALEEEGFEVIQAATGEEALDRCRERIADALLTDIMLPGKITGWDIAEHCREADPNLPVVYVTGYSHLKPRPVPGSRFLQKPVAMATLAKTIRNLVERRP
jgi:CheY-like chemotaxis protein